MKLSVARKEPLPENVSELLESLGWVFKELRKEQEMFVPDFAKVVKATPHRVRELEAGGRDIKISTLVKWADALGYVVSIEFTEKEVEE